MKFFVRSRDSVVIWVDIVNQLAGEDNALVISVKDPKSKPVDFGTMNEDRILRLSFHDVDFQHPTDLPDIVRFDGTLAKLIKVFMLEWMLKSEDADKLVVVVHCEAGISRSAAIAAALSKHCIGDDSVFFRSPFIPNRMVYKILLDCLNNQDNPIPTLVLEPNNDDPVF